MHHRGNSLPPPSPTEYVSGDKLLLNALLWLSLWISLVLVSLCVYQRTRSNLHMPIRPTRIRFSLFRSPHVSLVY